MEPFDVVVTTYNAFNRTKDCIESLVATTNTPYRLIIVDHSSDESVKYFEELQNKSNMNVLIVRRRDKGDGLSYAWNLGWRLSDKDIVVVCSNDIVFAPGCLDNLVKAMRENPSILWAQPYNTNGKMPDGFPNNYKPENKIGDVPKDNMIGVVMGLRVKEAAEKIGYFDERFKEYGSEDYDYLIRADKAGCPLKTVFSAYHHHYSGEAIGKQYSHEERTEIWRQNAQRLKEKYHAKKTKIYIGGTFDLFHPGHLNLFKRAREMADIVCVSVNRDEFNEQYKGERPIMTLEERIAMIEACKYVDEVIVNDGDADSKRAIMKAMPDFVLHGDDWTGESLAKQMGLTEEFLKKYQIEMKYVPYTQGISSSDIKKRIIDRYERRKNQAGSDQGGGI